MKNIIIFFLILIVAGEVVALRIINKPKGSNEVLSQQTEVLAISPTPSPTETPTPTPEPTSTPLPTPTKTPSPTPVPQPKYTSEEINGFIDRFASQYGVDANILRHIAVCESGFNPEALKLSYAGLYQFGPITWQNIRKEFGEDVNTDLRFNAEEAVQTAAYAISVGKKGIWPNCFP